MRGFSRSSAPGIRIPHQARKEPSNSPLLKVIPGEVAESAEGAPLLREYGYKTPIEGSNPSLSANFYCKFKNQNS